MPLTQRIGGVVEAPGNWLVCFVLYNQDDGSALMEYRDKYKGTVECNSWVYPGGMLEAYDGPWVDGAPAEQTLIAAVLREAREELAGVRLLRYRRLAFNEPLLSPVNGTPTTAFLVFDWRGTVPPATDRGHPLQWRPLEGEFQNTWVNAARIARRAFLSAMRPPANPPGAILQ